MLFSSFFYRSTKFIFLLFCLLFLTTNYLYSQNTTVKATRTESIKTDDGYVKINVLNHSKNKLKVKEYLTYFWFSNNKIHFSNGGYSGKLLMGAYTEFYANDQLKEQGHFKYGLRTGKWKKWFSSGLLYNITEYSNGLKTGHYREYDEKGNLKILAKYKKGLLQGKYCVYANGKQISKTKYRNGKEVVKKEKEKKKILPPEKKNETKEKKCFIKNLYNKINIKKEKKEAN